VINVDGVVTISLWKITNYIDTVSRMSTSAGEVMFKVRKEP